jgi:manganese transport protein
MDPGNFATNIQGGAEFGYLLLWVILASNLMAMLIQSLSAKLGIASGLNLAEQCRNNLPRPVVLGMWVLMELVAMATDLAEFLGAALGLYLLLGIPLWIAGLLTVLITFLILGLERYGFRPLEAVITALVGVVRSATLSRRSLIGDSLQYSIMVVHSIQRAGECAAVVSRDCHGHAHVIFLHSALTQDRSAAKNDAQLGSCFDTSRSMFLSLWALPV